MQLSIRLELNPFRKVLVHLNTQQDDIHLQLDHNPALFKPDSTKLIELEVLMRPA